MMRRIRNLRIYSKKQNNCWKNTQEENALDLVASEKRRQQTQSTKKAKTIQEKKKFFGFTRGFLSSNLTILKGI